MTNKNEVMVLCFPRESASRTLDGIDWKLSAIGLGIGRSEARGLVFQSVGQVVSQQVSERQLKVDALDTSLTDPDALEEHLVEESPNLIRCDAVGLVAVGCERQRSLEVVPDVLKAHLARLEDPMSAALFCIDAPLLLSEEVDSDRIGVVSG